MPAEAQPQSPAGADQPSSQIHQLLDHGFNPSAFGRMPHRPKGSDQARLPNKAEDVEGKGAQSHHQGIGGELAARQPFEIKIGLELAVELLRGGMLPIELDHLFGIHIQVGPPALKGNLRRNQKLTLCIDGPLGRPDDARKGIGFLLNLSLLRNHDDANPLPRPGRLDSPLGKDPVAPGKEVVSSEGST